MKHFLYLFLICFCSTLGTTQNKIIDGFYKQYKALHNDDKTKKDIEELIANLEEKKNTKSTISNYKIIHQKNGNDVSSTDIKQLLKSLRAIQFEEIVRVNEGTTKVYMMSNDADEETIANLFMLFTDIDEFLFFNLSGNMNFGELISSGFNFSTN